MNNLSEITRISYACSYISLDSRSVGNSLDEMEFMADWRRFLSFDLNAFLEEKFHLRVHSSVM